MEDKRTALAIFLIIAFVMVYSEVVLSPYTKHPAPNQAPQASPTSTQASTPQNFSGQNSTAANSLASNTQMNGSGTAPPPSLPPSLSEINTAPFTIVETQKSLINIPHLGARISSLKLKEHTDHIGDNTPLDMVSMGEGAVLPLGVYIGNLSDTHVLYTLSHVSEGVSKIDNRFVLAPAQELVLTFTGQLTPTTTISKILKFNSDSYLFGVEIKLSNALEPGSQLWLEWGQYLSEKALHDRLNIRTVTELLSENNKIKHTNLTEIGPVLFDPVGSAWIGITDKYFTATLIPSVQGLNARMGQSALPTGPEYLVRAKGAETTGAFNLYVGPKDFKVLKNVGFQLERSIDLGFFSFLAYPLLQLLRIFYEFLGNYGLSVVLLTLSIKSIFFPLNRASLKSMKAMQELQPEMKALRERIKDPTQLNQEILGLYKKRGVNPMGGCLPILIQIPVFFGLYSALQHSIELRHAPFALWMHDLSSPERLELWGINVPVMSILMASVMFLQQYLTPAPSMDPTQRRMMLTMSGGFGLMFIIFPFPAGLALYMLVNTLISLVQQSYMRNDDKAKPFAGTLLASLGIFGFAYILTLLK